MPKQIRMPKLSDTMEEGRLIAWRKKVGDPVKRGEVLARVHSNDAYFSSFHANVLFASETTRHTGEIGLVNPETGEVLPVEAVAGKVFSQQAELIGIVTILHDLTQALEFFRTYAALEVVPLDHLTTRGLRAHLAVVAGQLDIATVFVREWRYLEGERHERFVAERRRYEERIRELFRDGVEASELRTDLDVATAALLFLSAANWAYTWLRPGSDTDQLADRLYAALLDGMRGYATP